MAVPKLRFKDENGADYPTWENTKIANILKILHGKDYKDFPVGDIPVLATGGIISYIDRCLCDWACVLIGRKGTIDKPQYMETPFWTVDTLFYSKPFENEHPKFQYYLFANIKWKKYDESTGVPSLSASTIENIDVCIPCYDEQKKIADFLTTFDKRITAQQNIIADMEETKKGLLQKIFSQEIRFKDDNGEDYPDWEKKKLGDIATKIGSGKTPLGGSSVYTDCGVIFLRSQNIGWGEMLLDDITYIDENTNNSMLSSQVKKDDLLLNITGASIGRCSKYYLCQLANVNQHVCIIRLNQSNADFILQQMIADIVQNQIEQLQAGGNRQGLNFKNVSEIKVKIPCLAEQNKIASFLSAHDKKIEAEKKILADLQEMKKGLLQQMFV